MGFNVKDIRDFARGNISESALKTSTEELELEYDDDDIDLEDEEFLQECMAIALPMSIQDELLDNNGDKLDEAVNVCLARLSDYFVGQGLISEAAAFIPSNPKITVMHLGKEARIKQLSTIFALKLARRDKIKPYKKYKIGQMIRKKNLAMILKRYGAKSNRLAKKAYEASKRGNKVKAAAADAKPAK